MSLFLLGQPALSADPAAIKASISKGAGYIRSVYGTKKGGQQTLLALALYKAGLEANSPEVQKALQEVLAKFSDGKYMPGSEHLYEAGLEATLLSDLDAEKYENQLTLLRDYIVGEQKENGGWDYPNGGHGPNAEGDTSVIQYACLGLWAIERAQIPVSPTVWEKVLTWHSRFQNKDGGFPYCPGTTTGDGMGNSTLNMSVNAVGNMHIAMLHIDPQFLPLRDDRPSASKPGESAENKPKFGVLETVKIENTDQAKTTSAKIPPASIDAVRRAFGFVGARFLVQNTETHWSSYYYYSLERMAALANVEKVGTHDWYNECADHILTKQENDGSWLFSNSQSLGRDLDTAFAVLFLTRSTGKLLKRKVAEPGFGEGLLAGGRGLPDDLSDVDFNGRKVKGKEKPAGPLDELLASLQNPGEINVDDLQEQIVQKIQLGDRETLVGKKDLLVKLVSHPDGSVRQMAMWALGRTDDMHLARYLIDGLSDVDPNVMMEAQNALCWIARRPRGIGLPENPLDAAPDGANAQQKQDAVLAWRNKALTVWGTWYLENRLYADRADQFESRLRAELENIRAGIYGSRK